jgi:hypothetical protein
MADSTIKSILAEMERGIEAGLQSRAPVHEPHPVAISKVGASPRSMPEYVEHRDGATEIGRLSAEAVVREYEAAAKGIEAVGAELIECIGRCQAVTRDAFGMTAELKEIAERYREEAKRAFLQIENCSLMTADVRKTCEELKDKISFVPAAIAMPKP